MTAHESCTVGSCQRHGKCMYLNHPRCPMTKADTDAIERALSAGRANNPYQAFSDEGAFWNEGFTDAWAIVRAALSAKERS